MTEEIIEGEAEEMTERGTLNEAARNLPAVRASEAVIARGELSVDEVVAQKDKIVQVIERVMRPDIHYGVIPGVKKPSLLKPGAEAINVALRLAPHYESERIWHEDGHLTVVSRCTLRHIPTDLVIATGEGLCSSREAKYAYRTGGRICPLCGADAIIKGKTEYGGGWLCFRRKGGCGEKWTDGSPEAAEFASAEVGRVANPDLADTFNTVLKMSNKRSMIAAVLNGTAASDVFTQDVEDAASGGAVAAEEVFGEAETRAFDPATMLLDTAPRGRDAKRAVADEMRRLDPGLDWQQLIAQATAAVYGVSSWRDLDAANQRSFWYRLSNAVAWISEQAGPGDFPLVEEEIVRAGFAFGFGGWAAELPLPRAAPDAPLPADTDLTVEDVPFGEDM